MQDSLNALQSYLDTLKDKGISFQFFNCNNESIRLNIVHGGFEAKYIGGIVRRVDFTEEAVSGLLEEVENYVESIVETRS